MQHTKRHIFLLDISSVVPSFIGTFYYTMCENGAVFYCSDPTSLSIELHISFHLVHTSVYEQFMETRAYPLRKALAAHTTDNTNSCTFKWIEFQMQQSASFVQYYPSGGFFFLSLQVFVTTTRKIQTMCSRKVQVTTQTQQHGGR